MVTLSAHNELWLGDYGTHTTQCDDPLQRATVVQLQALP